MNKLGITIDGLKFDASKHIYEVDGKVLPSVTSIINFRPDPFRGISKEVLDAAADRGTVVHEAIETWLEYKLDVLVNEEHRGYFSAFVTWFGNHDVEPLATELGLYHPVLMYAGKLDMLANVDGMVTLVDYKTASSIDEVAYGMQLEAYRQALKMHGVEVSKKLILQLKADGTYREFEMKDNPQVWLDFNCGRRWYECWNRR